MSALTKTAWEIFNPVDGLGKPRGARMDDTRLWGTELEQFGGATAGHVGFASKAAAEAASIAAGVDAVVLDDFATAGDGGGARYLRRASEPAHPGKFFSSGSWWEIAEPVLNPYMFGAIGNATTDDTVALQNWDATAFAQGKPQHLPGRTFVTTGPIMASATRSNVHVYGDGPASKILTKSSNRLWTFASTIDLTTSTAIFLTAAATVGSLVVTVNSTASLAVDQWIILQDNSQNMVSLNSGVNQCKIGEVNRIKSIDSATQITLWKTLEFSYTSSATPGAATVIRRWTAISENIRFENFAIAFDPAVTYSGAGQPYLLHFACCVNVAVDDITIIDKQILGVRFGDCILFRMRNCTFIKSPNQDAGSATLYTVVVANASAYGSIHAIEATGGRHVFTTSNGNDDIACAHVTISDSISVNCELTAWDTHPGSREITFVNCKAIGQQISTIAAGAKASTCGFNLRGFDSRVINPEVVARTTGVCFSGTTNCAAVGGSLINCGTGIFNNQSTRSSFIGTRIVDPSVNAIYGEFNAGSTFQRLLWRDIDILGNPSDAGVRFLLNGAALGADQVLFERMYMPDVTTPYVNVPGAAILAGKYRIIAMSAAPLSHTGTTAVTALAAITVPANAMGLKGRLRVTTVWSYTNSANNKTLRVTLAGAAYLDATVTTTSTYRSQIEIASRNATNAQVGWIAGAAAVWGSSTAAVVTSATDDTIDRTLNISAQLANAGETITLEHYLVELIAPG